jgi:hypothetical protein
MQHNDAASTSSSSFSSSSSPELIAESDVVVGLFATVPQSTTPSSPSSPSS